MDMTTLLLATAIALLLVIIWGLLIQRSDLRHELAWLRKDAKHWKDEAVKRGWKNAFEECADGLDQINRCVGALSACGEQMRRANRLQVESTEKLERIDQQARQTAENLARMSRALAAATAAGRAAGPKLLPAHQPERPARPATGRDILDRLTQEALRRAEADAAAGRRETDPRKLN